MKPDLHVVAGEPRPETLSERVRRLQGEAQEAAAAQVAQLIERAHELEALALDVAAGGDLFPPGIRDEARRLAQDAANRATTINVIRGRSK